MTQIALTCAVTTDTTVLGRPVARGNQVICLLAADVKGDSDLAIFRPDRWLEDGVFDPDAAYSLPFSLGPRGCFGRSLAVRLRLPLPC